MMSVWHLLWIVPVAAGLGMFCIAILSAGGLADELHDWMREQENKAK